MFCRIERTYVIPDTKKQVKFVTELLKHDIEFSSSIKSDEKGVLQRNFTIGNYHGQYILDWLDGFVAGMYS